MKNIISASRRTDIPAFYSEWFVRRLKEGEVYVRNPYGGQTYKVSLKSDDVHSIVFWSKNYSPLIPRLDDIERTAKNLFFHFTITGIPEDIKHDTPPASDAIDDFIYLSKRYSPDRLVWRFDPICLTDKLPFEFYEEMFLKIAGGLSGRANKCYISFVQKYKKVLANFRKYSEHLLIDIDTDTQKGYAERLTRIAEENGITLHACCSDHLLSEKVRKGSCINGGELIRLSGDINVSSPPAPTRKECACTKSIDIGSYDTCPHGCLYCYANADKEKSRASFINMDMGWNGLGFNVDRETAGNESPQAFLF
ncbi:MAG: DUF1848 domain-containing protein [Nitrospirota bacterium]